MYSTEGNTLMEEETFINKERLKPMEDLYKVAYTQNAYEQGIAMEDLKPGDRVFLEDGVIYKFSGDDLRSRIMGIPMIDQPIEEVIYKILEKRDATKSS